VIEEPHFPELPLLCAQPVVSISLETLLRSQELFRHRAASGAATNAVDGGRP
jgi:hypothetical protein